MLLAEQIPLSVYVHIPWCVRKCPYCDFNSHTQREEALPEKAYLTALEQDLIEESVLVGNRSVQSIFIGGGTPSLFSVEAITDVLELIRRHLNLQADAEITMEANPGTFEQQRFAGYLNAGINRLSLGVQSFDNGSLQRLGRIHNSNDAETAYRLARQLGFDNINLDLMHGLPGQTLEMAMADLRTAIELASDHLSWYQLTIEPNTEFHAKPPSLPVDDTLWDIQEAGWDTLADHGYQQYEVSAYARNGRQARHNLNYWQFGDYVGIGAGAHGKLTLASGEIVRRWKKRQPKAYMSEAVLSGQNAIDKDALPFEFMLNALRLTEGVTADLFSQRTGVPSSVLQPLLVDAIGKGLLTDRLDYIEPTQQGRLFLNDLLEMFLIDEE